MGPLRQRRTAGCHSTGFRVITCADGHDFFLELFPVNCEHPSGTDLIYVPDEDPDSVFVITAYELQGKARTAYRRRQRRKPR